ESRVEAERRALDDSSEGAPGDFGSVGDGRGQGRRARRRESRQFFADPHRREIRDPRQRPRMIKKADAAAALLIVAAVAVVYRGAASAYFCDDDFQWLVGTWAFHPAQLLDFANLRHFYRPVIDVYFAAATPLFSGSPA